MARDLIKRGHLVRGDGNLDVLKMPNNRLEFGVVHTVQGLHYFKIVGYYLFFMDGLLNWSKVLLIRQVNVVEKGALTGEESTSDFK